MTTLIICETCGYDADKPSALRPGKKLYQQVSAELLARAQTDSDYECISVKPFACLMSCQRHCAVQLRSATKIGYTLGDLRPARDSVEGLLDYARLYHQSSNGQVAYKAWPEQVKGKFISRFPALADLEQ
jgi:predicted metal-binding protein